jgi:hypothetical protein
MMLRRRYLEEVQWTWVTHDNAARPRLGKEAGHVGVFAGDRLSAGHRLLASLDAKRVKYCS